MIDVIRFLPTNKKENSLLGMISFKYNNGFLFKEIFVHKLRYPKGNILVRLSYPETRTKGHFFCKPLNIETQIEIDSEISSYIVENHAEVLK